MKRGGRGTARLGLHIHEHEVGGNAGPIGEMRKVQSRLPASASPIHQRHRQRGEDALGGIHLYGDCGEHFPCQVQRSAPTPRSRTCRSR